MSNVFDYFTVVSNIVRYVSWNDLKSFKRINSLCCEICEREENRRCFGIQFGYLKIEKNKHKSIKRRKTLLTDFSNLIKEQFQCKQPKFVLIMSNEKDRPEIVSEIIANQCGIDSTVCYIHSKHGIIGSHTIPGTVGKHQQGLQLMHSFTGRVGAISWLCLPGETRVDILSTDADSDTDPSTRLVLVLNDSQAKQVYSTSVFCDSKENDKSIHYCGGLVNSIEIYDHTAHEFKRVERVAIALGGDNLVVNKCALSDDRKEALDEAFTRAKQRNDELCRSVSVKYQCALVFSCYLRRQIRIRQSNDSGGSSEPQGAAGTKQVGQGTVMSEYEWFSARFPEIPIAGVLCEGEISQVSDEVIKLVKCLHDDDLNGDTSIFLILTWTN